MAAKKRRSSRLVDSGARSRSPERPPAWVAHAYGFALILGDFFLGRPLVESFDAFSDQGLAGLSDPFAWLMLCGLVGWWVVLLPLKKTWAFEPDRPISTGVGITVIVMAFMTAVLLAAGVEAIAPELSLVRDGSPNVAGIFLVALLLLAFVALQWWRLQMFEWDPQESDLETDPNPEAAHQPDHESREPEAPAGPRTRMHLVRAAPWTVRLTAGMLLLPAGWALMAPADFSVRQAQSGIELNSPVTLERISAAALFSLFSAAFGMFMAYGPRALAARVLGEGLTGVRFFVGLWLAHCVRLCVALLGA